MMNVGRGFIGKGPIPTKEAHMVRQIIGKDTEMGNMTVRRILPHRDARAVGPFIFFDHMGPVDFSAGQGIDVAPHPHIGLATVTYLFDGAVLHHDSLAIILKSGRAISTG